MMNVRARRGVVFPKAQPCKGLPARVEKMQGWNLRNSSQWTAGGSLGSDQFEAKFAARRSRDFAQSAERDRVIIRVEGAIKRGAATMHPTGRFSLWTCFCFMAA
jgi:hypothetical protein